MKNNISQMATTTIIFTEPYRFHEMLHTQSSCLSIFIFVALNRRWAVGVDLMSILLSLPLRHISRSGKVPTFKLNI